MSHKGNGRQRPIPVSSEDVLPPRVAVTVTRPSVPILTLDEAIGVLESSRDPYTLFLDHDSQEISLLRRMDDGQAELVVPRRGRARRGG